MSRPEPIGAVLVADGEEPGSHRYVDQGRLGRGSLAEVRRVHDRSLRRTVAMKILRARFQDHTEARLRFVDEARATAQLHYPNIVPVHEIGVLADGRPYFTMDVIEGRTLGDLMRDLHRAANDGRWSTTRSGWTLRRLVAVIHTCCDAVGYAHSRGVVHRDLKPENIMIGPYGQVFVMDWGLAKVVGEASQPVFTERMEDDALSTNIGTVAGTPAYMAPEQAAGAIDQLGPATDVYALGAILYELLSFRRPYEGSNGRSVVQQVLAGPPPPVGVRSGSTSEDTFLFDLNDDDNELVGPPVPAELAQICDRAMSRDIARRYATGHALGDDLRAWLDGDRRRDAATRLVTEADAVVLRMRDLTRQMNTRRAWAREQLESLSPRACIEDKRYAWSAEVEADTLERRLGVERARWRELLYVALREDPACDEAHARLADHWQAQHEQAEADRDLAAVAGFEQLVRLHDRGAHESWLRGEGSLTLTADPADAELVLWRLERVDRRLERTVKVWCGRANVQGMVLPIGSYVAELHAEGRATITYPIRIDREVHWRSRPPDAAHDEPVKLPFIHGFPEGEVVVPAGWFRFGGLGSGGVPLQRVWVDTFVIQQHPVTNHSYVEFLDDLIDQGRHDEALRCVPQERGSAPGEPGSPIYGRTPDGHFRLIPDADGDKWEPDYPVFMVDHRSARAYAAWRADRDGLPWRLVDEVRWEKAARGVDARLYPWGDHLDPIWACMRDSHEDRPLPAVTSAYKQDVSVYGVAGMAGNLRDWCLDPSSVDGPRLDGKRAPWPADDQLPDNTWRVARGGHWLEGADGCRTTHRYADAGTNRDSILSIRLVRPL